MAKVYAFPQKKRLPKGIEKEIHRIAREYVEVIYASAMICAIDGDLDDNLEEVNKLVSEAFEVGLLKAMEALDES